jgi:hypothetical protein
MADKTERERVIIEVEGKLDPSLTALVSAMKEASKSFGDVSAAVRDMMKVGKEGGASLGQFKSVMDQLNTSMRGTAPSVKGAADSMEGLRAAAAGLKSLGLDVTGQAVVKLGEDIKTSMARSAAGLKAATKEAEKFQQRLSAGSSLGFDVTGQAAIKLGTDVQAAMKRIEAATKSAAAEKLKLDAAFSKGLGLDATGTASVRAFGAMGEALKRADREARAATTSMAGFRDMMRNAEATMSTLPQRIDYVTNRMKALAAAGQQNTGAYLANQAQLNSLVDAQKKLQAASQGSTNAMRSLRFGAQNASFQLQDMAIQFQMGTRASIIFTQQVPQLLSGFSLMGGKIGAIAGALALAAAAAGIFFGPWIDKMQQALSPTAKFDAAIKAVEASTKRFGETVKSIDMKSFVDGLLSAANASDRGFFANMKMFDLDALKADAEKAAEAAAEGIKSRFTNLNPFIALNNAMGITVYEADRLANQFKLTEDQATKLAVAMKAGPDVQVKLFRELLPELKGNIAENRELYDILLKVEQASRQIEVAEKARAAAARLAATADSGKAVVDLVAVREEAKMATARLRIKNEEKSISESVWKEQLKAGEITKKMYLELTGTTAEYNKQVKDVLALQEKWATLLGKTDPALAFKKAAKEAGEIAKQLGKSPEELQKVLDYLAGIRDKAIDAATAVGVLKAQAESWGVSEEVAKAIVNIGKQSDIVAGKLKVMARFNAEGMIEDARRVADSLELSLLPSVERAASAFRRLGEESSLSTKQGDYDTWRRSADGLQATADQAIRVAEALKVVPANADLIQAAFEKMSNDNTGIAKMTEDVKAFIEKMRELGQMTPELEIALLNMFDKTSYQLEAFAQAMGNVLSQTTGAIADLVTDSDKNFREMAAGFAKSVAKMLIQAALLQAAFMALKAMGVPVSFLQGMGMKTNAVGNAYKGATGLPQGVYAHPTYFAMPRAGLHPFATGGVPGMGVLAEAGRSEAIVPLVRHGGDLGVKASPVNITVNNTVSRDTAVEVESTNEPDGTRNISILVRREVRNAMGDGSMDAVMRNNYGMRRAAMG